MQRKAQSERFCAAAFLTADLRPARSASRGGPGRLRDASGTAVATRCLLLGEPRRLLRERLAAGRGRVGRIRPETAVYVIMKPDKDNVRVV